MMENTYWRKQNLNQPLFPELIWSRPEHKSLAGKLLIIGGNLYAFSSPAEAYDNASQAGAGAIKVLLPNSLSKTVGKILDNCEFAPSTPSGSFAKKALAEWLDLAQWSDAVLLSGDFGKNSETAVLLESFIQKNNQPLTAAGDAIDGMITSPTAIARNDQILLVMTFSQLQKLATSLKYEKAFTSNMDILNFTAAMHDFTKIHSVKIIVNHQSTIFCAADGQIISTPQTNPTPNWTTAVAAQATVWWMQNPTKPLEALATSLING